MRKQLWGLASVGLMGAFWLSGAVPALAQAPGGTIWSGTESLPGFGLLTFEFPLDGSVLMIDAHGPARGSVRGTWSQQGKDVTLRFADCEYRGRINGQYLSGTAHFFAGRQAGQTWTFDVQRR